MILERDIILRNYRIQFNLECLGYLVSKLPSNNKRG